MKYEHLSQCVGKTLTKIIEPLFSESVLLVFTDVWTVIEAEADDDDAYLDSPLHKDKTRLVHCGYDKSELIDAGIIGEEDLVKIQEFRKRSLRSQIAEAEHQLKNLQTQARLEGLT